MDIHTLDKHAVDHDFAINEFVESVLENGESVWWKLVLCGLDHEWYHVTAQKGINENGDTVWNVLNIDNVMHIHDGEDCKYTMEISPLNEA